MESIHVSLPAEVKERLVVECQRLGLSMAAFVRVAVVERLESGKK